MAIQPIDLQTMYSQMNNVAKTVSQMQQGNQLTQAMQEANLIRQNAEQATLVHKTADDQAKSQQVKDEGHQSQQDASGQKRDREGEEQPKKKVSEIRETYLGLNVDISG